jgi:phospholipase A-2-activating protein
MDVEWELSRSYTSDGVGIRCAVVLPADNDSSSTQKILTGTQSGSLVEYDRESGDIRVLPYRHNHAVTVMVLNDNIYATGCKDSIVRLFDVRSHELVAELKGHADGKPVTSLAFVSPPSHNDDAKKTTTSQYLVSGSWDGTARVWNVETRSVVAVLPDHENSVCVATISYDDTTNILTIATGSAGLVRDNVVSGHTVRLWSVHVVSGEVQLLHTVANEHDGPIRDIMHYGSATLLTCSNDGTVKIRDSTTGICHSTMMFFTQQQHPPMLLCLAALQDTLVATAEDGHVVVWNTTNNTNAAVGTSSTQPYQIIRHGTCVWKALVLPDGDVATCCDDGVLRIFTRATERRASAAERQAFADDVRASIQKTMGGPSADEIAQLPRWEDHMRLPGRSEGQVQVFQKNGVAVAAQWSAVSATWIEVGEVTGRSDAAGTIDGVQYDHVFPIEIENPAAGGTGVTTLHIGYNTGENPFVAAQRFVDAHMLPQYHLQQIAEYVRQRAGQHATTLGEPATTSATTATTTPMVHYDHFPIRTYKSFDLPTKSASTTLDKMKIKLQEFAGWADDNPELQHVSNLISTLANSSRYHSSKINDVELKVLANVLQGCTPSKSFPALDLVRLAVLHPDAAERPSAYWIGIVQRAIALLTMGGDDDPLEGPAVTAVPMLALRLFANAFKAGGGAKQAVIVYLDMILDGASSYAKTSTNKNVRLSIATLLYNTSCYWYQAKWDNEAARDNDAAKQTVKLVEICHVILNDAKSYESEAIVRMLLALGTVCLTSSDAKTAAVQTYFLNTKVEMAASSHTDLAKAIAKEVYSILSS